MTPSAKTNSAKTVAREMIESWARNDLATARTLIADDAIAYLAHTYGVSQGGDNPGSSFSLRRWIELLQEAIDRMPKGITMTCECRNKGSQCGGVKESQSRC